MIEPSQDGILKYYPCAVTLRNGTVHDRVYVVDFAPYIKMWGVTPAQDPHKASVLIEDVVTIGESLTRLPARVANCIYKAGETGMGYCAFTVIFRDGSRQAYITGNAVDFIEYPKRLSAADIVDIKIHTGRHDPDVRQGPKYYWCIYDGVEGAS